MSVFIKYMTIPSDCRVCPMLGYECDIGRTRCTITCRILSEHYKPIPFDGRPYWCPAQEVAVPHGRLIDADAFAERIKSIIERQGYDNLAIQRLLTVGDVLNAVIADLKGMTIYDYENAPTIIEAEGVKE